MWINCIKYRNKAFYCTILALVACSYLFWGLDVELIYGDEQYMALCCKHWKLSPLGILTFYQGHLWTCIFGEEIYYLRILSKLIQLIAVGIGCTLLYKNSKNLYLTLTIGALSLLVTYLSNNQLYGWDSGAYLSEALFTVLLMGYISTPTLKKASVLGVACAIMICSRLPLVVGAFLGLLAIVVRRKSEDSCFRQIIKDVIAFLLSTVVSWGVMVLLMCGSFVDLVNCYSPQNFITGHGDVIQLLIPPTARIRTLLPGIILSSTIGFIAFFVSVILSKYKSIPTRIILLCNLLMIVLALCIFYYYFNMGIKLLAGVGIPLFVCTICLLPIRTKLNKSNGIESKVNKNLAIQLVFLSLCFFLPVVGSDTWFERFSIGCYFPIELGIIYPVLEECETRIFKNLSLLLIPSLVVMTYLNIMLYKHEGSDRDIKIWGRKLGTTFNSSIMNQLEDLTRDLDRRDAKFTFFGSAQRFAYIYAFEKTPNNTLLSYPLHHFYVKDGINKDIKGLTNKDVVIFPKGCIALYPQIVSYLKQQYGYIEYKYSDDVDVLYYPSSDLIQLFSVNKEL